MQTKKQPAKPVEVPAPGKYPEINPDAIPDRPEMPEEDPDIIPDEDPYETPPYELPDPGEAP